ncbi:MAG: FkbM family methyltransferase [Bacteroidota bacterium]
MIFKNLIRKLFTFSPFEKIILLFTKNSDSRGFTTRIPAPNHFYKTNSIRNVKRNGINYQLNISDFMDWYLYFGFAEKEKKHLFSQIKNDFIIYDIGANIGELALNFSKYAPQGHVYAFEPDSFNFSKLQTNIRLNSATNLSCFQCALGDQEGTFKLYSFDKGNRGMNRILNECENRDFEEVKVYSLDQFVKTNQIPLPNLIKIDVEGFEYKVLLGAQVIIEHARPFVFIEIIDKNLKELGTSAEEVVSFFRKMKYRIFNPADNSFLENDFSFSGADLNAFCFPLID